MPDDPGETDPAPNLEVAFFGLPGDQALPDYVGSAQDWAKEKARKIRRLSGDETVEVRVASIGRKLIKLPSPDPLPGEPGWEPDFDFPPDGKALPHSGSGMGKTVAPPGDEQIRYVDQEPVVMVYFDDSKIAGLPAWTDDLEMRLISESDKTLVPTTVGFNVVESEVDRPEFSETQAGFFDTSLTSVGGFAFIAGGFGLTYYLFSGE
jgi:hypothetical protein